jgi:hypothetical protein
VFLLLPGWVLTLYIHSFGTSFDMMRTGYDPTGVRKAVEGEMM